MFPLRASKEAQEKIHEKTLWILKNLGVVFDNQDAREVFQRHGARIEGNRVYIDSDMVEKAIATFIASFQVKGLNSEVTIGGGETVFSAISGVTEIQQGKETRPIMLADYINIQKLHQSSDIVGMCAVNICDLPDIEKEYHDAKRTAYTLLYTDKPLIGLCGNGQIASTSIKIAKEFFSYDGNYIMGIISVHSPLEYSNDDLESMHAYASENQPICITCCSMTGLSSPVTIEGTVLQNNAEVLAGLVYIQLLNPGLPVVYGNLSMGFDMRYGCPTSGIETTAIIAYAKAMADYYHIPCRAGGNLNDAKMIDYQAAQETCFNLVATLDNEIDFVYQSFGALNGLMQFSNEKFILDEEMVRSILWLSKRGSFKEENLNLDDIESQYLSGVFLNSKQTVKNFKKESFLPGFINRGGREYWLGKGMPDVEANAIKAVKERLENYRKPQMALEQEEYLKKIIKR